MRSRGFALKQILSASGVYLFFTLQFFIPTDYAFDTIRLTLKFLSLSPEGVTDKPLFVAIFFFPFYIALICIFITLFDDVYNRLSFKRRSESFFGDIQAVCRYYKSLPVNNTIDYLFSREDVESKLHCRKLVLLMIDFIITDLRDSFQRLLNQEDIRVAVFVEANREIEPDRSENVLSLLATTEFDKDYQQATYFRKPHGSLQYQGFCGDAWHLRRPRGGAARRGFLLLTKDERFFKYNPRDFKRSFLCLPVMDHDNGAGRVEAIISIDSASMLDFIMTQESMEELHISTKPLQIIIKDYLNLLQLIS